MKQIIFLLLTGTLIMSACSSDGVKTSDPEKKAEATEKSIHYTIDVKRSELRWSGKKLAYGHTGLIKIKSGEVTAEGSLITSGKFIVDMHTIRETGNDNTEKAEMLASHLMSADFFDAANYPETAFEITAVSKSGDKYSVSGNLTIKGVSKNITFPAQVSLNKNELTATADVIINRNDWGISYGSGLTGTIKDQAIHDDIAFAIKFVAVQ